MTVRVTRSSVCMGDDAFDNSRDILFDDGARVCDIIRTLNENSFFPHVSGNDVMWAVENSRKERILEFYTKSGREVYKLRKDAFVKDACGGELKLHCVYYSNYGHTE